MQEEENLQNIKKQYPNFSKETDPELLDFILSKETSSDIARICLKNGITNEEKIEKIAHQIALVVLGQTPKENLIMALKKEAAIDFKTAKNISEKVNKTIFSEILFPENETSFSQKEKEGEESMMEGELMAKNIEIPKPPKNDAYKEPLG
jgi:hypothetical protein